MFVQDNAQDKLAQRKLAPYYSLYRSFDSHSQVYYIFVIFSIHNTNIYDKF